MGGGGEGFISLTEHGAKASRGRSGEEIEAHVDDHGQCQCHNHERWHRQCPVPERHETHSKQPSKPAISYSKDDDTSIPPKLN